MFNLEINCENVLRSSCQEQKWYNLWVYYQSSEESVDSNLKTVIPDNTRAPGGLQSST